jgi:hypothetical protein
MKQHCVTIVGAGKIGSRHLQALSYLKNSTRIDLVDPSSESLKFAKNRYLEIIPPDNPNIELRCHNNINALPKILDLVIIATNSSVREKVLKDIAQNYPVKNFILEKILFQRAEVFFHIDSFLRKYSIPTWVNCWMRTTDLCKTIKSALNLDNTIKIKVEGSEWRMGTSSIHFMDILSYFSGCSDFKFTDIRLSDKLIDSRHKGFKEFSGQLLGQNSRGDTLNLICLGSKNNPTNIEIVNGDNKYKIIGLSGKVAFESSNGLSKQITKANLPYQSELTHLWVNDILSKGSCDLPIYSNCISLHLELIRVFTNHIEKITGKSINSCPIT